VTGLTGVLGGVGAIAGFAALTKKAFSAGDTLGKTADKLGLTTEALAGMRHAAGITGVGVSTLDMALQRMVRRIAEAAKGTGEAKGAIAELGLDAAKLAKLSPEKQFAALADAMNGVKDQGDKVRLSMKLFDSEGVALVNTLALGSSGLARFAEEAKRLGIAFSREDSAKLEQFNDALDRFHKAAGGLATVLAIQLAGPLERSVNLMTGLVLAIKDINPETVQLALSVLKVAAALGVVIVLGPKIVSMGRGIINIFKAIGIQAIALKGAVGGPAAVAISLAALTAGAAGAFGAFKLIDGQMASLIKSAEKLADTGGLDLGDSFTGLSDDLTESLKAVGDEADETKKKIDKLFRGQQIDLIRNLIEPAKKSAALRMSTKTPAGLNIPGGGLGFEAKRFQQFVRDFTDGTLGPNSGHLMKDTMPQAMLVDEFVRALMENNRLAREHNETLLRIEEKGIKVAIP